MEIQGPVLTVSQISPCFTCLPYESFENTVGKREITRNEQFLLLPQRLLPDCRTFYHFYQNFKLSSANSFSLEESKTCRLGKGEDIQRYPL